MRKSSLLVLLVATSATFHCGLLKKKETVVDAGEPIAAATATASAVPTQDPSADAPPAKTAAPVVAATAKASGSKIAMNAGGCPKGMTLLGPPSTPGQWCYKKCAATTECSKSEECAESMQFGGNMVKVCDIPEAVPGAASANGKPPLSIPATTDRVSRNRRKDGACPKGFSEEPGSEDVSTCARTCKTDSDCHAHSCIDSDVGNGKVCSNVAPKPGSTAKPATVTCRPPESNVGGACMVQCVTAADCKNAKGKTCVPTSFQDPSAGLVNTHVCM